MADLTKCNSQECPLRFKCYRFTASTGIWQSWFMEVPYDKETKKCEYYWINNNDIKYVRAVQGKYKCELCGRDKFQTKRAHTCNGVYRKHKIKWTEL